MASVFNGGLFAGAEKAAIKSENGVLLLHGAGFLLRGADRGWRMGGITAAPLMQMFTQDVLRLR